MISMEMLRNRVCASDAWECIVDVLNLDISPKKLAQSASDEIIMLAFVEGSIKSKELRDKLHNHSFPDISKIGIYSDSDIVYHVGGGLATAIEISAKSEQHNHPFESAGKVLDFGCGTSRVLRYMVEFLPGPQYYGSEVFRDNIDYGKSVFPEVIYLHHDNHPSIDVPDRTFDIIYAYSIFTHLEEKLHLKWLSELHRILQNEGIIILTIHGKTILKRCKDEESVREPMCIANQNYEKLWNKFNSDGYVFYSCYDSEWLSKGGIDSDVFGISYISGEYIKNKWTDRFRILEHDKGAVSNWQDYVVMKKL